MCEEEDTCTHRERHTQGHTETELWRAPAWIPDLRHGRAPRNVCNLKFYMVRRRILTHIWYTVTWQHTCTWTLNFDDTYIWWRGGYLQHIRILTHTWYIVTWQHTCTRTLTFEDTYTWWGGGYLHIYGIQWLDSTHVLGHWIFPMLVTEYCRMRRRILTYIWYTVTWQHTCTRTLNFSKVTSRDTHSAIYVRGGGYLHTQRERETRL
jgi:hypothetical protein